MPNAREKLIELLRAVQYLGGLEEKIADHLIANGVTVQECKAGDVVYQTDGARVYESTVKNVLYDVGHFAFDKDAIGKSVFLTRKEAEVHLPQPPKGE